jgi:hypothetical protein
MFFLMIQLTQMNNFHVEGVKDHWGCQQTSVYLLVLLMRQT